jgi:uncharacterized protein (TIGR02118 family)
MPFQLTVLYRPPEDPVAFDEYYDTTHTSLVVKLPGLRSFVVTRPGPDFATGEAVYHLIAALGFDDEESAQTAMFSPEGATVMADLDNFAQAGMVTLTGPSTTVR